MSAIIEKTIRYEDTVREYGAILARDVNDAPTCTIQGPSAQMTQDNIRKVLLAVGQYNINVKNSADAAQALFDEKGITFSPEDMLNQRLKLTKEKVEEASRVLEYIYQETGLKVITLNRI